jgi:hypothetical protein
MRLSSSTTSISACSAITGIIGAGCLALAGRLLLIVLHGASVADPCIVGVQAGMAKAAPLAKEIPALIQVDLDRVQPFLLCRVEPVALRSSAQVALLFCQTFDLAEHAAIVH